MDDDDMMMMEMQIAERGEEKEQEEEEKEKEEKEEGEIIESFYDVHRNGLNVETLRRLTQYSKHNPLARVLEMLLYTQTYACVNEPNMQFVQDQWQQLRSYVIHWGTVDDKVTCHKLYAVAACLNANLLVEGELKRCDHNSNNSSEFKAIILQAFQRSANMGSWLATTELGYLLQDISPVESFQMFQMASESGKVPTAFINLGYCYQEGIGVEKDESKCIPLYTASGVIGLNNLANCYELGIACAKDYSTAAHYYRLSAEFGVLDSMYDLSHLLEYGGYGIQKNMSESLKYLDMAASRGHVSAIQKRNKLFDDLMCFHLGCSCKAIL